MRSNRTSPTFKVGDLVWAEEEHTPSISTPGLARIKGIREKYFEYPYHLEWADPIRGSMRTIFWGEHELFKVPFQGVLI